MCGVEKGKGRGERDRGEGEVKVWRRREQEDGKVWWSGKSVLGWKR